MMPRKFTHEQLDQAEQMHANGEKWAVVDLMLGEGIAAAVWYRKSIGYIEYNEERETRNALLAWDGVGDRQSFIAGFITRAKTKTEKR